jgi:hypothetical protein
VSETKTEACTECGSDPDGQHWDWCRVPDGRSEDGGVYVPTRDEQAALLMVAMHAMADTLSDTMTGRALGDAASCSEADAIASVLAYSGHVKAAATWLTLHAADDDGDQHAGVNSVERALAYVRAVWGMEVIK